MTIVIPTKKLLVSRKIPEHWLQLVPGYESKSYPGLIMKMTWEPRYAESIRRISEKRAANRVMNYLDPSELSRAKKKLDSKGEASVRFGVSKPGHGYSGERGDFCLVGGVIRGRDLTVFYRSLELIGGFAYDLCLFRALEALLDVPWRNITVMATKANVFALKGNSNEKLYPKLRQIFLD